MPSHDLPEGSFEALIIMPPQNRSKHSQDNAHCKYQVCHDGLCPAAQQHQQSKVKSPFDSPPGKYK